MKPQFRPTTVVGAFMRRTTAVVFSTLLACLAAAAPASAALQLTNSFVSSKGWVKPGETYPLTVTVTNPDAAPADGGTISIAPVPGMTFTKVEGGEGGSIQGGSVKWNVGSVPAGGRNRIVVEGRVASTAEDPQIVWKDLSTTATGPVGTVTSHGPKVIPASDAYNSARYGDRPFPVVPVDYLDRKHAATSGSNLLERKINDPGTAGSTFNLYQEMSYNQLFPHADVPSVGVATAGWDYKPGFAFTKNTAKVDTCTGVTTATLPGETGYTTGNPQRVADGWYQLPGTTQYYGQDSNGSAIIGSAAGVGALQSIDSGCGPAGKAVFDAATIADPDIDYDEFDTDKDGVVDFFMMVFAGRGGNGDSQIPSTDGAYDNIWPHSSSLEESFADPTTGITGYVSDDQATDQLGRPLWYTDESYTKRTTDNKGDKLIAHTRVGPYNVNPETAITKASVISHEYGHSLGLPDFYSTGSRETYGSWTLMATDHSQHIDVFGRQELGWLVPRVLEKGKTEVKNAVDSTHDTHRTRSRATASTTARGTSPSCRRGRSSTRRRSRPAATCSGRRPATTSGARR
jgi:immune inhibitor A